MNLFPWRNRKHEHEAIDRRLALQERIVREAEKRLRRLEQEMELHRLRRSH